MRSDLTIIGKRVVMSKIVNGGFYLEAVGYLSENYEIVKQNLGTTSIKQ